MAQPIKNLSIWMYNPQTPDDEGYEVEVFFTWHPGGGDNWNEPAYEGWAEFDYVDTDDAEKAAWAEANFDKETNTMERAVTEYYDYEGGLRRTRWGR